MLLLLFKPLAFHMRGKSMSAKHSDFVHAKNSKANVKNKTARRRAITEAPEKGGLDCGGDFRKRASTLCTVKQYQL